LSGEKTISIYTASFSSYSSEEPKKPAYKGVKKNLGDWVSKEGKERREFLSRILGRKIFRRNLLEKTEGRRNTLYWI